MHMVMLVLDQTDLLDKVLDAWAQAGAGGATIIESTGLHRRREKRHIPMRFAFEGMGQELMKGHYTLMAVVSDEQTVQRCLEATEQVVGDLSGPNTGVFASWPLGLTRGMPKRAKGGGA